MEDNPNWYTIKLDKSTEGKTDNYNITWTIPMFKQLMKTKPMATEFIAGGIRTPKYTIVDVPDTPFQLMVGFFGLKTILMDIYYLTSTSSYMKWSLDCVLGDTSNKASEEFRNIQANEWQYCEGDKFTNDFNISTNDSNCTESLRLSFKFTVTHAVKADACNNIHLPYIQLSEDFGNLLTDDSLSDVTMKSDEGIEFRVHKSVLSVRRAHFEHNTTESITNVVEAPWETEVLRDVLTFVYKGEVPRVDDAPDKLLAAADYYQLMGLKSLCEEALYKRLTVENAIETLQLAELHSANSLSQSILKFIKDGRFKLVTKTQGWAHTQSVEIIKRICEYVTADVIDDILAAALMDINIE
ncbi:Roadkill [Operophtera brumata]|uniref:Roadkill n=1 Tax=Operophtera brumata TaxID=104452 RepID=A0A0L7KZP8_OPEBR|nr:Roadkill [Operophtera brumata]